MVQRQSLIFSVRVQNYFAVSAAAVSTAAVSAVSTWAIESESLLPAFAAVLLPQDAKEIAATATLKLISSFSLLF